MERATCGSSATWLDANLLDREAPRVTADGRVDPCDELILMEDGLLERTRFDGSKFKTPVCWDYMEPHHAGCPQVGFGADMTGPREPHRPTMA